MTDLLILSRDLLLDILEKAVGEVKTEPHSHHVLPAPIPESSCHLKLVPFALKVGLQHTSDWGATLREILKIATIISVHYTGFVS